MRVLLSVMLQDARGYHHHMNPSNGALIAKLPENNQLQDPLLRLCSGGPPPTPSALDWHLLRQGLRTGACLGRDPWKHRREWRDETGRKQS